MTVKYSRVFTVTGAITRELVTILVECIEAEGFRGVSIESLEGGYPSTEEFKKGMDASADKIYNFLPLMLPDARQLVDTLNEALMASELEDKKEAS